MEKEPSDIEYQKAEEPGAGEAEPSLPVDISPAEEPRKEGISNQEGEPREESALEKEAGEEEPLTADKAVKLIFLSYRFSQGGIALQVLMYRYLKQIHPSWQPDETHDAGEGRLQDEIVEKGTPIFIKYLKTAQVGSHSKVEGITPVTTREEDEWAFLGELDKQAKDMLKEFSAEPLSSSERRDLIGRIAIAIIERDYNFLHREDGRPRPNAENAPGHGKTAQQDRFLSHLARYGIEGASTGSPEYDQMFKDVVEYLREAEKSKEGLPVDVEEKLNFILKIYNEKSMSKTSEEEVYL